MAVPLMRNPTVPIALVLLLSSCQSAGPAQDAQAGRSSWRAIERVGEARYRAPSTGDWAEVVAGSEIPAASTLVTGAGGRLILARPGRQIVVGTKSRVRLPGAEREARLEQLEGRVLYRITGSPAAFAMASPALDVQTTAAVLQVSVGPAGTEVTVEQGEAQVATPDGDSVRVVAGGGSVRAGGPDGLMVRRRPGQGYEPATPLLGSSQAPALEPGAKRSLEAATGAAAAARNPGGGDGAGQELVVVPAGFRQPLHSSARQDAPRHHDAVTDQTGTSQHHAPSPARPERKGVQPGAATNEHAPGSRASAVAPAGVPEDPFVRLTDGLLNALPATSPTGR